MPVDLWQSAAVSRWYELAPCDADVFDAAPVRYRYPMELSASAERVWAELTGDRPLSWCRLLGNGRYTTDRPFGVGTNRTIQVAGLLRLRQRFFRWEEGRRHSFFAVQASLPLFHRFAEDYLIEPTPTGCRFTWTFALEPGPLLRPTGPLAGRFNAPGFASRAADTRRHFGTPAGAA